MKSMKRQMKKDWLRMYNLDLPDHKQLFNYFQIRSYKRNAIIKSHCQLEIHGRFLISGMIGLFEKQQKGWSCRRIFTEREMAMDLDSYLHQRHNHFKLTAYSPCWVGEISKQEEAVAYQKIPGLDRLAVTIIQKTMEMELLWKSLLFQSPHEAYHNFLQLFPYPSQVKVKDISGMLNIPERTIYRIRKVKEENALMH